MEEIEGKSGTVDSMLDEAVLNMNNRIPYKHKPVNSITDCLNCKPVVKLRALAKLLFVTKTSSMRKAELVSAISDKLTNKDVFTSLLLEVPWEEYDLFKSIVSKSSEFFSIYDKVDYIHLHALGLMYAFKSDDGFILLVPDEIKVLWNEAHEEIDHLNSIVHRVDVYALAAVRLYGLITVDDFITIFNGFESESVTTKEMQGIILSRVAATKPYYLWEQYLVNPVFGDDLDGLLRLKDEQKGKPRFLPDRDVFLSYASGEYLSDSDEAVELAQFLSDITGDMRLARSLVLELSDLCACGASMESCIGLMYSCNIEFDDESLMQAFQKLLTRLWQVTRLWGFHGHTPFEMEKMWWVNGPWIDQDRVRKLGRNDPCPCGSGKKYKKCCGA